MAKQKRLSLVSVITPFPYSIENSAAIDEAKRMMEKHDIRHLIVREDGDIAGVLSERDLLHHAAAYGSKIDGNMRVGDICSGTFVVADINDPLEKVLEVMAERHLGSVVVLNKGDVAGIFTATDACKHFARFIQRLDPKHVPDLRA